MICYDANPSLGDVLSDPLIQTMMAADGVDAGELEAMLRSIARSLASGPRAGVGP